jgi:hypothetical protein
MSTAADETVIVPMNYISPLEAHELLSHLAAETLMLSARLLRRRLRALLRRAIY